MPLVNLPARALAACLLALTGALAGPSYADAPKSKPHTADPIPTFNRDIAPIVYSHCASCHRTGQATPFQLMTYGEVKTRGQQIADVTKSGIMPPWKAGIGDCALKDVNRLSATDLDRIQRWVATGMHEGRPSDLPPIPTFPDHWQLGTPDMIVKMPRPYHVPADGPDIYRTFVVPLNLTADKWVTAIEYHPSARQAVHHCLFFYDATGGTREAESPDGEPGIPGAGGRRREHRGFGGGGGLFSSGGADGAGSFGGSLGGDGGSFASPGDNEYGSLGGWAVGANTNRLPGGLAYHLPKGSDLILAAHFHMSGKADVEQAEVGLYFTDKAPERQFTSIQLPPAFGVIKGITIQPGDKDWVLSDSITLPCAVKGFGVTGHAHMIAKSMQMTATLPDGSTKTLITIPNWDFAWQGQYQFQRFEPLPKRTKLEVAIHYDNSADNPHNPFSPPRLMRWGPQSTSEMGSITLMVIAADDNDMPALKAAYRDHVIEEIRARTSGFRKRRFGQDGE